MEDPYIAAVLLAIPRQGHDERLHNCIQNAETAGDWEVALSEILYAARYPEDEPKGLRKGVLMHFLEECSVAMRNRFEWKVRYLPHGRRVKLSTACDPGLQQKR